MIILQGTWLAESLTTSTNKKVPYPPTLVVWGGVAHLKASSGDQIIVAQTLLETKIKGEQVRGRVDSHTPTFTDECHQVAPWVWCYLGGRDPLPSKTRLNHYMEQEMLPSLKGIVGQTETPEDQIKRMLPKKGNKQYILNRDTVPRPQSIQLEHNHDWIIVMGILHGP